MDSHHFQKPSIFHLFLNVWSSSSPFTTDHIMRDILYIQLEHIVIYEPHGISNTWKSLIGKERKEERVAPSYFRGELSPDAYMKFHVTVVIRWQKKGGTIRVCKVVRRGAVRRNDPAKREKGGGKKKKERENNSRFLFRQLSNNYDLELWIKR